MTDKYDSTEFMRDLAKTGLNRSQMGRLAGGYHPNVVSRWTLGIRRVPRWVQSWMQMLLRLAWLERRVERMEEGLSQAGFSALDFDGNDHEDRPEPLSGGPSQSADATPNPPASSPDQTE